MVEQEAENTFITMKGSEVVGIPDDTAAALGLTERLKTARRRRRDENNHITWVCDRLYGLTASQMVAHAKELKAGKGGADVGRK